MPKFSEILWGTPDKYKQLSTKSPEQMQLLNQLLQMLGGGAGGAGQYWNDILSNDPEAMARFEAPYRRQFEQETLPGIAERFAGMGTGGSLSSSGLNQSLSGAAENFSSNLASMREGLKGSAAQQMMQMIAQMIGISPFENIHEQGQTGVGQEFLSSYAKQAGKSMGGGSNPFEWLSGAFGGGG